MEDINGTMRAANENAYQALVAKQRADALSRQATLSWASAQSKATLGWALAADLYLMED